MVRITEHDYDHPVENLEVALLLSKRAEVGKFGTLKQSQHNIYFVPDTPLGSHISIHDADKNHLLARIHLRIPPDKGVFESFPGGAKIGNATILRNIPKFNRIKDAIPIYEGHGWISIEDVWQQSPECDVTKVSSKKPKSCIDLASFTGEFMGFQILLIGKGNMPAVSRWCEDEIDGIITGSIKIKSVDVFKAFVPWLAVVVEDYQSHII